MPRRRASSGVGKGGGGAAPDLRCCSCWCWCCCLAWWWCRDEACCCFCCWGAAAVAVADAAASDDVDDGGAAPAAAAAAAAAGADIWLGGSDLLTYGGMAYYGSVCVRRPSVDRSSCWSASPKRNRRLCVQRVAWAAAMQRGQKQTKEQGVKTTTHGLVCVVLSFSSFSRMKQRPRGLEADEGTGMPRPPRLSPFDLAAFHCALLVLCFGYLLDCPGWDSPPTPRAPPSIPFPSRSCPHPWI